METTLKKIQSMPTCIDKIHESCFRSAHILTQVRVAFTGHGMEYLRNLLLNGLVDFTNGLTFTDTYLRGGAFLDKK